MQDYGLTLLTPPAEEPVTLALAKTHLRIDHDTEDALIQGWIQAARELAETYTQKRFVSQELTLTFCAWPDRLPIEPIQSVDEVRYYDTSGTLTTLDVADYQTWLDRTPPHIAPTAQTVWPPLELGNLRPVAIDVTAGYASVAEIPAGVKNAILLTLGYWDKNRGDDDPGAPRGMGLSAGALRLLDSLWTGGY